MQEEDQWVDAQIFNTLDGKLISGARVHVREGGAVTDSTGRYYYHGENNSSGANLRKYDLLGDTFTPLGSSRPGEGNYYGSRTVVISEDDSRIFWAGTAFDRDLNIVWDLPGDVYSVSPNGRYAFGESTIYDINRRTEVLGMPLQTNVSAFNSETEKLITGDGKGLRFDLFRAPFALAPPVPISFSATASSVTVAWEDHSFELEFRLEYRRADEAEWTVVSESLPQNQTSYELRNLSPGSDYEIRLRAAANDLTSTWSETLRVTTTPVPPSRPNLVVSALSMTAITIGWTADLSLPIHFERREQDASAWEPLAVIPPEAAGTYVDRGLKPDTRYYYRARVEDRGIFSSYSWERSARTLVPQPPSFPQLRFAYPVAADTIELFWAIVPGASEIRVERRTDGGPWEPLAELPPEATRYLDAEVSSSSVLEYRVVAINEFGETPSSVLIASDLTAFQTLIDEETADGFDVDLWNPTAPSSTASFHQSYTFPEYTYSSSSGSSSFLETTDFNLDEFYGPLSSDEGFSFPPSFAILETFELPLSDDSILRLEFSEPITDASDYQIFVSEDGWNYTQVNGETVDSTTLLVELPAHGPTRLRLELGYQLLSHLQRVTVRTRGASEPIVPVPYVLTEPLNSTAVLVQWPMPEPSRWFLWANPFAAYRFRVERRGLQNDWQELDTILSSADPFFVDDTAPADSALQYRVVRVTPAGESAPSLPTFVRTMTQFSEWAQNNAPELLSGAPITDEHVLAFALGASPRVTRSADSSRLQMNVLARRHDLNPGVGYVLMGSHDLHHWEELAVEASAEAIDARWEEVSYNLPKEPIFVRLEVQVIE
ncbi:MAG: fibronectin type III domain-containing protein [Opitutales bacterium]